MIRCELILLKLRPCSDIIITLPSFSIFVHDYYYLSHDIAEILFKLALNTNQLET